MDQAMPPLLALLAHHRWIKRSYYQKGKMKIEFSERGRERLKLINEILPSEIWPKSYAEFLCLKSICQMAQEETDSRSSTP